jgi:signal transduction histidine kinase
MKTVVSRLLAFLSSNNPSPGLKQLAITVAFMISLLILLLVPGIPVTSEAVTSVGIGLLVLATLLSAAFTYTNPRFARWVILIPVIDFLAIGAYRAGTGGSESLFSAIITFPVVWIAAEKGRGYIVLAAIGSAIALLAPNILGLSPLNTTGTIVRVIFSPLVYLFVAAIVNELSRQSRAQLTAISDLAEEKERMLARTFEYAGQLEESEAKFRDADRMFRGVWAAVTEQSVIGTDVTGLIDAWNPGAEKLLGLNWRDAEGKRFIFDFHLSEELEDRARELNYPPGETVLNPGFSALVENARLGEAESREWTYVRDDGTTVPVALSVTQRMDEAGRTIGYLFVASDVTQAREVSRLKDEFVGLISHELRTPLSSILGYLELMRDDDEHPLSDEQEQYLAVAERNAHRLLRLVGDLLFTAQVESGKFPLDLREVDLENIVKAAVESARPAAVTAGITVVDEIFDDGALVYGDPVRLGQICDNLISNAVKFTPRGGTVTVSLSRTEKNAVITVRDTGMGIAESELDQLFSRFFRATTATKNAVPGVGLGLTITKALVTAQHGTMDVTSEEGVGTEFSVSLPLAVAASVDEPQLSA